MKNLFKIFFRGSIGSQYIIDVVNIFGIGVHFEDLGGWSLQSIHVIKVCFYGTWRPLNRQNRALLFLEVATPWFGIFCGNLDQVFLLRVLIVVLTIIQNLLGRPNIFTWFHLHRGLRSPVVIFRLIDGILVSRSRYGWVCFVTLLIRLNGDKFSAFDFWQCWSIYNVWLDFGQKSLTCSLLPWVWQISLINCFVFFETWQTVRFLNLIPSFVDLPTIRIFLIQHDAFE